jgi:thioredoxin 1
MREKMSNIITDADFEQKVLKSSKPVIVDFWAEWCAPCTMNAAVIADLSDSYGESFDFAKVNVDDNPDTVAKYDVNGVPTMLLFVDGVVKEKFVGLTPKDIMERVISYHF